MKLEAIVFVIMHEGSQRKICVKMEYRRDFESRPGIIDEILPVWRKILAMRVTTQFICVLLNLHVKEALRNNGYLRRTVFSAVFYGVSREISRRIRTDRQMDFHPPVLSFDFEVFISLSFSFSTNFSPNPLLKENSCFESCARLWLSLFKIS